MTNSAAWAAIVFALMAFAVARVTRFVTSDSIVDAPRDALLRWLARQHLDKLAELVTCPWCIGFWIAAAVVALTDWQTSVPLVALQVPAVAYCASRLVASEEEQDG